MVESKLSNLTHRPDKKKGGFFMAESENGQSGQELNGRFNKPLNEGVVPFLQDLQTGELTDDNREAVNVLIGCAGACKSIFAQLPTSNTKAVQAFAGLRPAEMNSEDTYQSHGERVAQTVVELGVLDPVAFCVAYLHDLGGEKVLKFSSNKIRTYLTKVLPDPDLVKAVVEGIEAFDTEDERSQEVTNRVFVKAAADFHFGQKFTPEEFLRLQQHITENYTNGINDITAENPNVVEVSEGTDDQSKFPSIIKVLREAATGIRKNANGKDRLDKKIKKRVNYAVHTAYLAAAIDNINNPKKGKTDEDSQKIALGLQQSHLPIYWAMGDTLAHAAEDAVFRAYFPEAYKNLQTVWEEIQKRYDVVYHKLVYQRYIDQQIMGRIRSFHPKVKRVDDIVIAIREAQFRRMHWKQIDSNRVKLLGPDEVYIPAEVDLKTPSSIFRKALKHHTDHTLYRGAEDKRLLRPEIVDSGFGTLEFWEKYVLNSYDIYRSRIILGDAVATSAQPIFDEMAEFNILDPENEQVHRYPAENMDQVWGVNCARVPFQILDKKGDGTARRDELVETKHFEEDKRASAQHFVLGLPIEGMGPNLELHVSGWLAYVLGYVGKADMSHLNYKMVEQIAGMAKTASLSEEQVKLLNHHIADLSNTLKDEYMENTQTLNTPSATIED